MKTIDSVRKELLMKEYTSEEFAERIILLEIENEALKERIKFLEDMVEVTVQSVVSEMVSIMEMKSNEQNKN